MSAEIREELRSVARSLLQRVGSDPTADDPAGRSLMVQAGWFGLEVPEHLGGAAATFREVAVVLHEMGRASTPGPFLGQVVLGVGALNLAQPGPTRDDLLRQVGEGSIRLAVGLPTGEGAVAAPNPPFRLDRSGPGGLLHGEAAFVPDAPDADRLLLLAQEPDGVPVMVVLGAGSAGLARSEQSVLDSTRTFGTVTADGVEVAEDSIVRFPSDPAAAVRRLGQRAATAVACDSLGLAEVMLETTVAYVGARKQFGRPVGSFQAVKHACADMLVQLEVSRRLLEAAVAGVSEGEPAEVPVAMAKAHVTQAAVDIAGKAMQLHGGIGYTWEAGIHVYLKRALLNRSLFGSPVAHRRQIARRYAPRAPDSRKLPDAAN